MARRMKLGVWIATGMAISLVITSCCKGSGTKCLYDKPCGGIVGVSWQSEEDWSYGLVLHPKGQHAPNTKALAVTDGNSDRFLVYGDGRMFVYGPSEFYAPIKVKEIYTDSGAKWPDYVFEPTYKLRNIYDLEAFIRQNKHLPGLPSQHIVSQQGIPLVTTQKALVEKVEELTLYVIALQKQVDSLKALLASPVPHRPYGHLE